MRTSYNIGSMGLQDNEGSNVIKHDDVDIIEFAEVMEIILDSKYKDEIGRIQFKFIYESGKSDDQLLSAYPLNSFIKSLPVLHEIVLIVSLFNKYYYLYPVNYNGYINNNSRPGTTKPMESNESKTSDYQSSQQSGIPNSKSADNSDDSVPGEYFKDNNKNIPLLKPMEGDVLLQGRFGNNIRFGHSVDKTNLPEIKISTLNQNTEFMVEESLDDDMASIWITSDSKIDFKNNSIPIHKDNDPTTTFDGKQIFIFSDRLVFQSKLNDMIYFSNKGIHFTCNLNYSIDSDKKIITNTKDNTELNSQKKIKSYSELETEILSLKTYIGGIDENEPLVIGGEWKKMMLMLLDILIKHKHPTGTGPSGPPIEAPELVNVKTSISNKEQLSDDNFTIKKNR